MFIHRLPSSPSESFMEIKANQIECTVTFTDNAGNIWNDAHNNQIFWSSCIKTFECRNIICFILKDLSASSIAAV